MSITMYLGPMWSAKTSRLISEYFKSKCINKSVLVINHILDDRYGDDEYLYSHDFMKIPCIKLDELKIVSNKSLDEADVILINEAQFFPDLKEKVLEWCEVYNKHIYIAGLDGDRKRKKFGQLLDLIPFADEYHKLKAKCKICMDGSDAIFTFDQKLLSNDPQVKVGSDNYLPLCRRHYLSMTETSRSNNPDYDLID